MDVMVGTTGKEVELLLVRVLGVILSFVEQSILFLPIKGLVAKKGLGMLIR